MVEIRTPYDLLVEYDADDLLKAQLKGEFLNNALFSSKDLTGSNFNKASLIHAWFDKANVSRCDFSFSDLKYARFIGACVKDSVFTGANLSGCNFHGCVLADANLTDIKAELMRQLSKVPESAKAFLDAINGGLVGQTGSGDFNLDPVGFIDFMAMDRRDYVVNLDFKFGMNASSRAIIDGWLMGIRYGTTPETNQVAKITANWIVEFLKSVDDGSFVAGKLNDLPDDWIDVVGRCAVCDTQLTCYDKLFMFEDQLNCKDCNKEASVAVTRDELPL